MTGAALLAVISASTIVGAHLLASARWPWAMPHIAIALWQAVGLAWGVATIGALLGVALLPYHAGVASGLWRLGTDLATESHTRLGIAQLTALLSGLSLAAVLTAVLLVAILRVVRARHRHRRLLALVARGEPDGTLVLDHPAAAAYCVPGMRSAKVVVSAGTLRLLDPAELAAVLEHERAHARERHDLVLLPFSSLRQTFPRFGLVGRCLDAVELLVEMAADDQAKRHRSARELATALLRFAAARPAAAPSGALAALTVRTGDSPAEKGPVTASPILTRVNRLVEPTRPHRVTRVAALGAATLIAVVPPLLYALPL
ncbi:MAG: M56 family metallopeptidase [Actinomadura sp.]